MYCDIRNEEKQSNDYYNAWSKASQICSFCHAHQNIKQYLLLYIRQ